MNKLEYKTHIESKGFLYTDELYYDRLNIDSNKYLPSLIRGFLEEDIEDIPIDELSYYGEDIVSNIVKVI